MSHKAEQQRTSFIREKQVLREVSVARSTLRRWIEFGVFPAPYKLGPKLIGFKRGEIDDWMRSRPKTK